MRYLLKRHPLPVTAFLRHCLVLAYAFPRELLRPLLPPGLVLDTFGDYGFMAIALVQTERLRPTLLPSVFGRDFFLAGYRIFTRLKAGTSSYRGLQILRSETDKPSMVRAGNLLTHYRYDHCQIELTETPDALWWSVRTPQMQADLDVSAKIGVEAAPLPAGSPFKNEADARRFAGPLPYTFDYEPETHSMIRIRAVRSGWNPRPVAVHVSKNTFLQQEPFCRATPILANAFYAHDVAYRWEKGVRTLLEQ
jgi:Uncharacterized conserved protein (COG2071)